MGTVWGNGIFIKMDTLYHGNSIHLYAYIEQVGIYIPGICTKLRWSG